MHGLRLRNSMGGSYGEGTRLEGTVRYGLPGDAEIACNWVLLAVICKRIGMG